MAKWRPGLTSPWPGVAPCAHATLGMVDWYNNSECAGDAVASMWIFTDGDTNRGGCRLRPGQSPPGGQPVPRPLVYVRVRRALDSRRERSQSICEWSARCMFSVKPLPGPPHAGLAFPAEGAFRVQVMPLVRQLVLGHGHTFPLIQSQTWRNDVSER